jgi:hypothetical protein
VNQAAGVTVNAAAAAALCVRRSVCGTLQARSSAEYYEMGSSFQFNATPGTVKSSLAVHTCTAVPMPPLQGDPSWGNRADMQQLSTHTTTNTNQQCNKAQRA